MSRPVAAQIDVAALRHNLNRVRSLAPRSKVMAVIKADAYGHGLLRAARALSTTDGFGVAALDEAIALRDAGFKQEICLLTGFHAVEELPEIARGGITTVVHCAEQLEQLESFTGPAQLTVWVKLDTGMHRIGFAPEQLDRVRKRLSSLPMVRELRLMSHLANADDPADPYTAQQLERFRACVASSALQTSLANSAGLVAWPDTQFDWVRPGIMLYGASPVQDRDEAELDLRPVMRFTSRLMAVHQFARGDPIGYGGTWRCPEPMPVGVVACGYADGYPRHAPSGTPVGVDGQRVPLIGRVSMDMLTVDLRARPHAQVGDEVELWGSNVRVSEVARAAGTIAYELLCAVSARVPRHEVEE